MKKLLILIVFSFISCQSYVYRTDIVDGIVSYRDYKEAKDVFEYHYGYSIMKGRYCYHWCTNHHDAEYITKIILGRNYVIDESENVYNKFKEGDTLEIKRIIRFDKESKKIIDTTYKTKDRY